MRTADEQRQVLEGVKELLEAVVQDYLHRQDPLLASAVEDELRKIDSLLENL